MNDESLEPLDIDDRAGGERMLAAGRAGFERLGALVDDQRLDIAALLWMLCTLTFVGVQVYSALTFSHDQALPGGRGWAAVTLLAQTGGPLVAVSCIVGIALALWFDTSAARFAILLAAVGGAWVLVAGGLAVASVLHEPFYSSLYFGTSSKRAVGVVGGVAFAGFGVVVTAIALRLVRARTAPDLS